MKRILPILLLILILAFSGCTKREDPGAPDPKAGTTQTEKKTLVFYNLFDPEDAFRGQIQAYESEHRDIDITYKKFQNVEEYENLVLNELAEGRGPDIFAIRNDSVQSYLKKILPSPKDTFIPETFAETFLGVANDDLVLPDADGFDQVWGVSLFIDTLAIYYNKELFRDNLPSTNKPAETWKDLEEQAFALSKADTSIERFSLSGIALGQAVNISHFPDILSLLLLEEGAELFEPLGAKAQFSRAQGVSPGTGNPFFPVKEAVKLYTSFALPSSQHASWNLNITSLYPEQKEIGVFARGKTAMIFGFSNMYNEIKIAIDGLARANEQTIQMENVGVAPSPQFSTSTENGKNDAFAKYYPFVVSRTSENSEVAWDFLKFLSTRESLVEYHKKTNKPTSRQDMIEEQSTEKFWGTFARQAPYAKSLLTRQPKAFFEIFGKVVDEIVKNKTSVDAGIQTAEKQMNCILKKMEKPESEENCFAS
ncbi:extracellular solute-binding protein [Candidatus Peregrinibacteria bacterium]|nr:extracellular solute-binding protein [Candidatus Peregrinibacteria bacterium]